MNEKLKVYLETSFVSYVTGMATSNAKIASDQAFTRQWWEEEHDLCDICTSSYTIQESAEGREDQVALRVEFLKGVPLLASRIEEEIALANKLITGHALPEGEVTDALHIAAASVAGADILLTWNCRHMANPHTLPITRDIVTKAGYVCPAVMTPKTFIENKMMEVDNV